jgi:uncharacterized membrane protein
VFAVNDMLYNGVFVAGAAVSVGFMPDSGKSMPALLVAAVGYVVGAACYRLISGYSAGGGPPSPSSLAQRSSS